MNAWYPEQILRRFHLCDRDGTLLVCGDDLVFLAPITDGIWVSVQVVWGNSEALSMATFSRTLEETREMVRRWYGGWTIVRDGLDLPREEDYDAVEGLTGAEEAAYDARQPEWLNRIF